MDNPESSSDQPVISGPAAVDHPPRVSRRDFVKAASIGAGGAALGVSRVGHAEEQRWDTVSDVVIVGSGGAALAAAAGALENGASVLILEKGPVAGGTTAKSGGVIWIPNNAYMQAKGMADAKDDAMRYMVRLGFPTLYREREKTLGVPAGTYELLSTFYDNGARVVRTLNELGAIKTEMSMSWNGKPVPDYYAHLPEDKAPRGRAVSPIAADGHSVGFGADLVAQLSSYAESRGSEVQVEHHVTRIVVDAAGRVIGVEGTSPAGKFRARATRGVVFGSGGFTQNKEMRDNYLREPVLGGCAVPTNQGDFVSMGIQVGARLGNMNEAWLQQEVLEEVLQYSSVPSGAWTLGGDSMIAVNKYGRRIYDEKFVYNERTRTHLAWDPTRAEYPNLYQFCVFDDHAIEYGGWLMPPRGADMPSYVITGATWDALATAIQGRLDSLADRIGAFRLDAGFVPNLRQTVKTFNGYAEKGVDLDFHRGEPPVDEHFHRPGKNNDKPNPWMYPISGRGPYHAIILAAGTLDTKGGPVTNADGQVIDVQGRPIAGLYAAGNCAASSSGQGYWGAGGTLGPAITFGFMAGEHAARSP